nr:MAG TPA: hypothetical protein [Caudoviricetes sp.]
MPFRSNTSSSAGVESRVAGRPAASLSFNASGFAPARTLRPPRLVPSRAMRPPVR